MIKPDGVARNLVAKIIERFEQRGYKLVAMKFMQAGTDHLKKHYADLSSKPFFPSLVKHIASGPVIPMVWEGKDVVRLQEVEIEDINEEDTLRDVAKVIKKESRDVVFNKKYNSKIDISTAKSEISPTLSKPLKYISPTKLDHDSLPAILVGNSHKYCNKKMDRSSSWTCCHD